MADISELIEQIRSGLDACTSGPWSVDNKIVKDGDIGEAWAIFETYEDDPPIIYCQEWQQEANARHIARCNPDNIRRLLDHIAELEAMTDEAIVTIARMGWDDDGKFTATAVFSEPPGWPVKVVWNSLPVRMSLPSSPKGGPDHG